MRKAEQALIEQLEARFRDVTRLLYDTTIPARVLDEELMPMIAEDVTFTDPWQKGGGKETYRKGAAGFHCMFRFDFDIYQLNIQLEPDGKSGRAMVDGVMNLKQFAWLYTYPLRTILVFDFTLQRGEDGGEALPLIHAHEEMWSFADMIANVPGVTTLYNGFRSTFSKGFLVASAVCGRLKQAT
ncbi:hypothetical protein [Corallococcus terminator]|uniref:Uncharacterized protein n=1 Tax=Corallococcus terminator TaxID=2316733 RepID=A0A3A8IIT8_9BACT|nr:hypothetical protein [Corallococcus terminator]RKG82376.1 hypothetical protein D7V88_25285 [Corallococcus terminator]